MAGVVEGDVLLAWSYLARNHRRRDSSMQSRCVALLLFLPVLFPALARAAGDTPAWQSVGWGGGGYFWSCAFHPTKGNVIYMGGDVLGMYKTEDKGRNWRIVNKGIANYGVYSLATAVNEPDTVYIMTEDGICRSTDAAENWTFLPATGKGKHDLLPKRGHSVRGIAVDPTDAGTVYAGSHSGRLCKSVDAGETWTELTYLPRKTGETIAHSGKGSLALSFAGPSASWEARGRTSRFLNGKDLSGFRTLTAQFYLPQGAPSLDGQLVIQSGENWVWQQGAWTAGQAGSWARMELDMGKLKELNDVKVVYCVFRSKQAPYTGPVFLDAVTLHPAVEGKAPEILGDWEKEGDTQGWGGGSKDMPLITQIAQSAAYGGGGPSGTITSIIINPANPRQVYVCHAGRGIFVSNDAGDSWQRIYDKGARNLAVTGQTVYAACGRDRVLKSTDGGKNWTAASQGMDARYEATEILIDPRRPDTLYCIGKTGWNGTFYRSTDGGRSWTGVREHTSDRIGNPTLPEEGLSMSSLTNITLSRRNPDELFLSANWRNLFSTDGGKTWEERSKGADITCATDIRFFEGKTYVTAMDEGLLVSDDHGGTWKQVAPLHYDAQVSGHMWRTAVNRIDGRVRILATASPWNINESDCPNRLVRSDDGGATFGVVKDGLPDYLPRANTMWGRGYPRALAVDPVDPKVVYLAIDGDPNPGKGQDGGGIFKSGDGGRTWHKLPAQPASRRMYYGLVVDPTDNRRLFFGTCGANGGVHCSTDGGATWEHAFASESWVFNVAVSSRGVVYACGNDIWKSEDQGRTWKQLSRFGPEPTVLGRKMGLVIVGVAIDPENEQRLWISRVNWGNTAAGAVMRSDDGGAIWTDISGDIPCRRPQLVRYNRATKELWALGPGIYKTRQP